MFARSIALLEKAGSLRLEADRNDRINLKRRYGSTSQLVGKSTREEFILTGVRDSLEQVRFLLYGAVLHRSRQVKQLLFSSLPRVLFEQRPQRRLGLMGLEGGDLGFQVIANVNDGGVRREGDRLPVGQGKAGGRVIELLCLVGGQAVMKLI